MNKLLSRIAIAIASFAMVIGGVSIANTYSKEQANPTYAENGDAVATFDADTLLISAYGYMERVFSDWRVSWCGDYRCGFSSNNWKTIEEQGYSKYVDGTTVSPNEYGWIIATVNPLSYIGGFDFKSSIPTTDGYIYLTYSLDGENYSLVSFTEGEQGTRADGGNEAQSFSFDSVRRAYYAIIITTKLTTSLQSKSFKWSDVLCHLYEKIDPNAERITVSGPDTTYVDEDIELTINTYNFNPTEYTLTSSDTSVATVSRNGNTIIVHPISRGTTIITVITNGSNGIVYIDPFTITVKKFEFMNLNTSIVLNTCETKRISLYFQDANGKAVLTGAASDNTSIADATVYNGSNAIISAGTIGGISTTVTLTAKDNNGNEGCHVATATIQVTVGAWHIAGERLTARPQENTYAYLATIDGSLFLKASKTSSSLNVTSDIKEATVFIADKSGRFCFTDSDGSPLYVYFGSNYFYMNHSSVGFTFLNNNDKYPGIIIAANRFMFYDSDETEIKGLSYASIEEYESNYGVSPSNVFCAYYAVDPGPNITPEETSIELLQGESTNIDAKVAYVSNATYEILSGAQCIEEVTVSPVDELNNMTIHIEASTVNNGTAVIRVKDVDDDSAYTDITVTVKIDAETEVGNLLTQTKLSYHYEGNSVDGFVFSNISIRFGAKINKDVWNQIDNDYGIDGFGVMITAYGGDSFSITSRPDLVSQDEFVIYDLDNWIADCYMPTSGENSMATPPEVDDDYVYNLFHRVDGNNERYRVFTAAAYIKLSNGNYLFMQQVRYSVSSLAADYIANRGCDDTTAGGSLAVLATPQEQE